MSGGDDERSPDIGRVPQPKRDSSAEFRRKLGERRKKIEQALDNLERVKITPLAKLAAVDLRLIDAVRQGDADTVVALVAAGVNVNAQDHHGMTALHHAAAIGARSALRLLVSSGKCDYGIPTNDGFLAADLAIEWARDFAVARLLTAKLLRQTAERSPAKT